MNLGLKRIIIPFLFCLLFLLGCVIPRGSRLGQEKIVSTRTNSAGQITERIVVVPTLHHGFMPIAPDGPEFDADYGETCRYYLLGEDGGRKELHFLRTAEAWDLIAAVPHTNLWVAVGDAGSYWRQEKNIYDYRVLCFNPFKRVSERRITCLAAGDFHFDSDRILLIYKTQPNYYKTNSVETPFDPLAK
jgi:hypothetical protein